MQRVLWFSLLSISFLVSGASEIVDNSSLHWSFNGLVEPTIPKVVTKGWVQNEIDCFILNRLEQKTNTTRKVRNCQEILSPQQ